MSEIKDLQERLEKLLEQNNALLQQNADLQNQLRLAAPPPVSQNIDTAPKSFAVSPKLAPFWLDRPAAWFAHIEAQFALTQITADETKYNYVVAQIDSRLAHEVEDLVINPPPKGKRYEWIKEEMIRRFSISEAQRLRQLISGEEIGDRKPTQFLRHLRSLAGKSLSDEKILRELWLQRLPPNIQAILTAQAELTLDKIAEIADKIIEVTPISVNAVKISDQSLNLTDITSQLQDLSSQVAALSSQQKSQRISNSRPRSRSRSSTPGPESRRFCWYHYRFGNKAQKCIQPCSWTTSGNSQNSQ